MHSIAQLLHPTPTWYCYSWLTCLSNSSETLTTTRERDAWGNVVSSSGTLASPFGLVGGINRHGNGRP